MRLAIRLAPPLLAAVLAAGCAAPRGPEPPGWAADCGAEDWRARGLEAAVAGETAAQGLARIAACPALRAPAAREAAEDALLAGHDEGRAAYCAPAAARELGRRGAAATLSCPPHMEAEFARAYALGLAEGPGARRGSWFEPVAGIGIAVGSRGTRVGGGVGVRF